MPSNPPDQEKINQAAKSLAEAKEKVSRLKETFRRMGPDWENAKIGLSDAELLVDDALAILSADSAVVS